MKKSRTLLIAALLLAFSVSASQAQSPAPLSTCDANALLEKTIGKWQVNEIMWQPDKKELARMAGKATYSISTSDASVHELCEILEADGSTKKTYDGYLCFSERLNQFEFIRRDATTGKEEKLFTGHWYPEYKTLLLVSVRPKNTGLFKKYVPEQWRYVFQDNGTFTKMVYQPDEKGNLLLMHKSNYLTSAIAGTE